MKIKLRKFKSITRYVIFFTYCICSYMLYAAFISVMIKSMDIELSNSDISMAAFYNGQCGHTPVSSLRLLTLYAESPP